MIRESFLFDWALRTARNISLAPNYADFRGRGVTGELAGGDPE